MILDFGCGNRSYSEIFSTAKNYIGIDFKEHTQYVFGDQQPGLYFDKLYTETFKVTNIQNSSFDTIVCIEVL